MKSFIEHLEESNKLNEGEDWKADIRLLKKMYADSRNLSRESRKMVEAALDKALTNAIDKGTA